MIELPQSVDRQNLIAQVTTVRDEFRADQESMMEVTGTERGISLTPRGTEIMFSPRVKKLEVLDEILEGLGGAESPWILSARGEMGFTFVRREGGLVKERVDYLVDGVDWGSY